MFHRNLFPIAFFIGVAAATLSVAGMTPLITTRASPDSIKLADPTGAADIYTDPTDFKVVSIAANLLAQDIKAVTSQTPAISHDPSHLSSHAIIIGTLGHSAFIDSLVASRQLDISDIQGKWESFKQVVIQHPAPNVETALVIAGSDRRGTAYGALDLSQQIGVSPWVWWADVTPAHQSALYVSSAARMMGPPSVQYRGIFINDEDWGFQPWAAKTIDPERNQVGPKAYEKVFELLLRLKLNYFWPAMHPCSAEFSKYPENFQLADDYAIVMGASHTETMLQNNVWFKEDGGTGDYRYDTNRDNILAYWEKSPAARGKFENVWTLGMRGIHDAAMQGPKDIPSRIKIVEQVFEDQRNLLKKYVNSDLTKIPQVFLPYKEVLTLYQRGLKVPEDITLMWCDDNFGYIRQLSTTAEQKRPGGAGIYYHLSYLGDPRSYTWLNTTPPALIYEEMTKAYAYGAGKMWILNVGDIKPGEVGIDFWSCLAWNINAYTPETLNNLLADWATETFGASWDPGNNKGPSQSIAIAKVMAEYYRLNYQRKPESMDSQPFSLKYFNEASNRLADFRALREAAEAINTALPPEKRDAFFELVLYPVRCSALTNEVYINRSLSQLPFPAGGVFEQHIKDARAQIDSDTAYYNDTLQNGKWKYMVTEKGNTSNRYGFNWPGEIAVKATGATPLTTLPPATQEAPDPSQVIDPSSYFSINADHYTRSAAKSDMRWQSIAGLGNSQNALTPYPLTASSIPPEKALTDSPSLDYDFTTTYTGDVTLTSYCIPTHPVNSDHGLRFAVAIDNETPQVVDVGLKAEATSSRWKENVLRNASLSYTHHQLQSAGKHTLHIYMLDPGVVLDQFVMDFGGLKPSYLTPPESMH